MPMASSAVSTSQVLLTPVPTRAGVRQLPTAFQCMHQVRTTHLTTALKVWPCTLTHHPLERLEGLVCHSRPLHRKQHLINWQIWQALTDSTFACEMHCATNKQQLPARASIPALELLNVCRHCSRPGTEPKNKHALLTVAVTPIHCVKVLALALAGMDAATPRCPTLQPFE